MRLIFLMIIVSLALSCSKTNRQNCKIIYFEKFQKEENDSVRVKLQYKEDQRILELSVLNLGSHVIDFRIPKLAFSPIMEKNKKEKDIEIKPYIPLVFISKSICYIQKDIAGLRKIISVDSTMQRNELSQIIRIGRQEKFIKELYLDCGKSNKGEYEIYFFEKYENDDTAIKITYPQRCILKIEQ